VTPKELMAWRLALPRGEDDVPVSRARAAKLLNNTPKNSYSDWEAGRRRIPRMLPLACLAVTKGWPVPAVWEENE